MRTDGSRIQGRWHKSAWVGQTAPRGVSGRQVASDGLNQIGLGADGDTAHQDLDGAFGVHVLNGAGAARENPASQADRRALAEIDHTAVIDDERVGTFIHKTSP